MLDTLLHWAPWVAGAWGIVALLVTGMWAWVGYAQNKRGDRHRRIESQIAGRSWFQERRGEE